MKPLDSDKKVSKEASAPAEVAPAAEEKIDFSKVEIEPLFADYVDFDTFSKSDFRAVKIKANCETLTYEQERQLDKLQEKLTDAYPSLEAEPPTFEQVSSPQQNM